MTTAERIQPEPGHGGHGAPAANTPGAAEHEHPAYTHKMRELLKVLWGNDQAAADALRLELSSNPTAVLKKWNVIDSDVPTRVVVHFDQDGVFHVPIPKKPKKEGMEDEALLTLASHLIRCCADGC